MPKPENINFSNVNALATEWGGLLYELSRQFASTLELDDLLGKVLSLTVQAVGANRGSIFLIDASGQVTHSILARAHLPPEIKYYTVAVVMREGFAGWVYRNCQSDIVEDTLTDDRWILFSDDTDVTRSAMAVPLARRGKVVGVITLTHLKPHVFTDRHLMLLEVIATQAAAAIENAAMYTEANTQRLKLQAIIEGVQDVIFVLDIDNYLILANPAAQEHLGMTIADYGKPAMSLSLEPALDKFCQEALVNPQGKVEVAFKDGRTYNCSLVHIPEIGRVVAMHDVTTFKQLDALKSQFVSHVSHDLKAPLTTIKGFAGLLRDLPTVCPEGKEYAALIVGASDRMMELINSLLDLGKIEIGMDKDLTPTDLILCVMVMVAHFQPQADAKGISLTLDTGLDSLLVLGSAIRLEQAVANLLGNAIKFTPPGGSVVVSVAQVDDQAVVCVADTGPGIPSFLQSHLFQKFSRLGQQETQSQEGHGLGLAIVKSIVDAHHGQVWVESEAGKGSRFYFSLPLL